MLPCVAKAQFVHQPRRKDVRMTDSQTTSVQYLVCRLDLLLVRRIGARQNRKAENAGVIEREVLQDEPRENVVARAELVIHAGAEALAIRIALGMVQEVVAYAGLVGERVVQRRHAQ